MKDVFVCVPFKSLFVLSENHSVIQLRGRLQHGNSTRTAWGVPKTPLPLLPLPLKTQLQGEATELIFLYYYYFLPRQTKPVDKPV